VRLYQRYSYQPPLSLTAGDRIDSLSPGAYTTTHSTVGLNGFAPRDAYCLPVE
jgi:ornithine decarboxylase